METEQQQSLARSWVTDAVIVGAVTFLFYLMVLFYEAGYCNYFGIPHYFIALDTTTLLAASPAVFLKLFYALVFVLIFYLVTRLISYLIEKFIARKRRREKAFQIDFSIITAVLIFTIPYVILGCLLFFNFGRNDAKQQKLFLFFKYKEIEGFEEYVVARAYGENIYAVPVNRTNKEFEKKLVHFKIADISKKTLTFEEVGQLKEKTSGLK
jgi:hypothetical protein